jgi:hypothetical protein
MYLTKEAVVWARGKLAELPQDQAALFWCLILTKEPEVSSISHDSDGFIGEYHKYFGAPIAGGGIGVFNPFDSKWKAENYIQSTVFGRLLNGSHWWTSPEKGFLTRSRKDGWPARFEFNSGGSRNLFLREKAPSTSAAPRLPIAPVAIYYYKFADLKKSEVATLDQLVEKFKREVVALNLALETLFNTDSPVFWGSPFSEHELSAQEKIDCFPPAPYSSEPKQNVLLYVEDVSELRKTLADGQSIADLVRSLMKRE